MGYNFGQGQILLAFPRMCKYYNINVTLIMMYRYHNDQVTSVVFLHMLIANNGTLHIFLECICIINKGNITLYE